MKSVYDDEKKLVSIVNKKMAMVFVVKYKDNALSCDTRSFSGVRTIGKWSCEVSQMIYIDLQVTQGRAKLILVKDKKVFPLVEGNYEGELKLDLEQGKYRLRMVGEETDAKLIIKKKV